MAGLKRNVAGIPAVVQQLFQKPSRGGGWIISRMPPTGLSAKTFLLPSSRPRRAYTGPKHEATEDLGRRGTDGFVLMWGRAPRLGQSGGIFVGTRENGQGNRFHLFVWLQSKSHANRFGLGGAMAKRAQRLEYRLTGGKKSSGLSFRCEDARGPQRTRAGFPFPGRPGTELGFKSLAPRPSPQLRGGKWAEVPNKNRHNMRAKKSPPFFQGGTGTLNNSLHRGGEWGHARGETVL